MNKERKYGICWLLAAAVLSLCTLAVAAWGVGSSPTLLVDPSQVLTEVEEVLLCAQSGEYERLGSLLYGQPDLGKTPEKTREAQSMIWYAFLESITYQLPEGCYALDDQVAVDVRVSCLDITAVTDALKTIAPELLTQAGEQAQREEDIYDENHNYREDFLSQVLYDATTQALAQEREMLEKDITLCLTRQGGRWQVVPTEQLLEFLSGFVSG